MVHIAQKSGEECCAVPRRRPKPNLLAAHFEICNNPKMVLLKYAYPDIDIDVICVFQQIVCKRSGKLEKTRLMNTTGS